MKNPFPKVELWPHEPMADLSAAEAGSEFLDALWPSGRQAVAGFSRNAGLSRRQRFAIPEWSSACVISCIGEVATPISISDALRFENSADALLIYEQWGWSLPVPFLERICEILAPKAVLLDRVDTASFDGTAAKALRRHAPTVGEVWSFSKLLGFHGGGLLRVNDQWQSAAGSAHPGDIGWSADPSEITPQALHVSKSYASAPPPELIEFSHRYKLSATIELESRRRRRNLETVVEAGLGARWPIWMQDFVQAEGAPGIVPLFRGSDLSVLQDAKEALADRANILPEIYHFNFAGDLVAPCYENCLAFPIHGQISKEQCEAGSAELQRFVDHRKTNSVSIVGGGIAGIVAARILGPSVDSVSLVDQAPEFGGLLRSVEAVPGFHFDLGTHFCLSTGHADVDRILFEDIDPSKYHVFKESLAEGHYYGGRFNIENGCLDTQSLTQESRELGIQELVGGASVTLNAENLESYGRQVYGPTFFDQILGPVMERLTGVEPSKLHQHALGQFSLTRINAFDSHASRMLKQAPELDDKLAYSSFRDNKSEITKYYPKTGGVGDWTNLMVQRVRHSGVDLHSSTQITSFDMKGDEVTSLNFCDGSKLDCDTLIWTAPIVHFLRLNDVRLDTPSPKFKHLVLFHLVYDQSLQTDLHWVTCYEKEFLTYRVTCYPNISNEQVAPPPHHLTVEVLADDLQPPDDWLPRVKEELATIGIVSHEAQTIHEVRQVLPFVFPVPTVEFVKAQQDQLKAAQSVAKNVLFLGRGAGAHFQSQVLKEVYDSLCGGRIL